MSALFMIVFVDLVGFGVIIPLLPFYAEHFQASPAQVGLLMATYSCTQFLAAPMWGRLSDDIGRRPVLMASLAGLALAYIGLAYADQLWLLFAARAAGGAMAGNIGVAFAYVADITRPDHRARGMGLIGAAFGLGFIFGPAIGGILGGSDPLTADYRTPALVAAALSATAVVLSFAVLKESLSQEIRTRQRALSRGQRRHQVRDALAMPSVGLLIVLSFLTHLVFSGMESTFALWSRRQFGWGPEQNGYLFAAVGLVSACLQGAGIGRLTRYFGERALVVAGAGLLAVGMLMIPFSATLAHLVPAMAVVACGFSLISPCLNSLISKAVADNVQGGVFGITRSAATFARIVGPILSGVLFSYLGKEWPFLAGAMVMTVVVGLSWSAMRNPDTATPPARAPHRH